MSQPDDNNQEIWQRFLSVIETAVSPPIFKTWFATTRLLSYDGQEVVIGVVNVFALKQFRVKLDANVRSAFSSLEIPFSSVRYEIITAQNKSTREEVAPSRSKVTRNRPSRHFGDEAFDSGLNPKYSLENFIVGSCNDLAYTACQAIATSPGAKYNPLFLYGGVGLGKTHLIQAVGNEIIRTNPRAKVRYISTETFVTEFLDAIRYKIQGFSEKYRNIDVLIVDDIQFIAGKEKTQEEFFHTFNTLHQANKQIIITSDKTPKNIPTLTERLRSRFEWGMAIDVGLPDFETRAAILKSKATQMGFELDDKVATLLAESIATNIRELEGALNQILAYCEMRGLQPDYEMALGMISSTKKIRPRHITPRQIIERTARYFQVPPTDILSPRRDKHINETRQIIMYLLREELKFSFPKIAQEVGRKDHTTAIHSVNKVTKEIALNATLRDQIEDIKEKLYV